MAKKLFEYTGAEAIREQVSAGTFGRKCPYLGMRDDPATILGYPDLANHCFRHKEMTSVSLKTQSILCLTDQFGGCAVFLDKGADYPQIEEASSGSWVKRAGRAAMIIPILLLLIAALVWWPAPGKNIEDSSSHAAPLQKILPPDSPSLGEESQATDQTSNMHGDQSASSASTIGNIQSSFIGSSTFSTPEANEDSDAESGFRVHTYD